MKHKLLSTAAVLLLVLLTWSCTADEEHAPSAVASAPRELSITVGSRPGYTPGIAAPASSATDGASPATRAIQTPEAAQWETGDVIWLYVRFEWTDADRNQLQNVFISALRYYDNEWLPLTEEDAIGLNTSGIEDFTRHPRWPSEALADGVIDAKVQIEAYYLGKNIPTDGILSLDYSTNVMSGRGEFSPGTPITLSFQHIYARLHVTSKAELSLNEIAYANEWNLNEMKGNVQNSCSISVPAGGGYYFVEVDNNSEVLLNGFPYTLAPGENIYKGYTYTLVPLTPGMVTPGTVMPGD